MLIKVVRDTSTDKSVTSTVEITGVGKLPLPPAIFFLEKPKLFEGKENVPQKTCIPPGRYRVVMTHSPKFGRKLPELVNVPGRGQIRIHSANWPNQLEGCLAPGLSRAEDSVFKSRDACAPLEAAIEATLRAKKEVWIEIEERWAA